LIVMQLRDVRNIDPAYEEIVVLFNARPEEAIFSNPAFAGQDLALHSVQQVSADERTRSSTFDSAAGAFTVPGRTTAVFSRLHEPVEAEPTALQTATQEIPAIADPNVLLTLVGVIGAFVAVVAMMFALRRKDTR
jgi:hypothetical protein